MFTPHRLIMAAAVVGPPLGALAGLPVLPTGAEQDSWVPVGQVREAAGIFREARAAVDMRVSAPAPHGIHPQEIVALRVLVRSVAPDHMPTGG